MPRVRVVHATEYRYHRPVGLGPHRLMLRPRDSHDLRLLDATLAVGPAPSRTRWAHDVFGNSVCCVEWDDATAERLRIVSVLDLEHFPATQRLALDPVAELYPFSYAFDEVPDLARMLERHYPDPARAVDAWARGFLRRGGPTPTLDLLTAMTVAIRDGFTYRARDAEGTNAPADTLATRTGACRDYAVLMMEAVRSLGLAARFLSGYLYDESLVGAPAPMVGGGATHAWVAVYLPGAGWVEFDPTNGLLAGRNLIRVCSGRTPAQAVPVAGTYDGAAGDFAGMSVDVQVAVGDAVAGRGG